MTVEEQAEQSYRSGSEFEREPVAQSALLGFKSFIGMYAGEHCAGTELMIGPLFIAAGVSVQIYFVSLPCWFFAAALYIVLSTLYQKKMFELSATETVAKLLGYASLIALILMGFLFLSGTIHLDQLKSIIMIMTVIWFVAATLWMWKENNK